MSKPNEEEEEITLVSHNGEVYDISALMPLLVKGSAKDVATELEALCDWLLCYVPGSDLPVSREVVNSFFTLTRLRDGMRDVLNLNRQKP